MSSAFDMNACCHASLVVTPMVDGLYHEGVVVLSFAGLVMRREGVFDFLELYSGLRVIVDGGIRTPNNKIDTYEGLVGGK